MFGALSGRGCGGGIHLVPLPEVFFDSRPRRPPAARAAAPAATPPAAPLPVPKRSSPGFTHASPATLSQPPSAFSRASRSSRHFFTVARDAPAGHALVGTPTTA